MPCEVQSIYCDIWIVFQMLCYFMEDADDCCNGGACWLVGKLIAESQCRGEE